MLFIVAVTGCSVSEANGGQPAGSLIQTPPERPCGSPLLLSVRGDGPSLGVFEVMNDTYNLWISFNHTARFQLDQISAYIGNAIDIPRTPNGMLDASKFNVQSTSQSRSGKWVQSIPLEGLPECMTLSVRVELTDLESEEGEKKVLRGWGHSGREGAGFTFRYCKQSCFWTSKCHGVEAGKFVTVPVEDWVDEKQKFNSRLAEQFDSFFPGGMEIGCNSEVKLESPEALTRMLATGGDPRALEASYVNAETQVKNDFANELCALSLTIAFDERLQDFCPSEEKLKNLEISQGAFKGWTIAEVFNEANTVLGGCTSNYSAFQMAEVLAGINQNFQGGGIDKGFLVCPQSGI